MKKRCQCQGEPHAAHAAGDGSAFLYACYRPAVRTVAGLELCEPCARHHEKVTGTAPRCDGFTRTGESDGFGGHATKRCERAAEYVCTTPNSEGFQLLCRHHKGAWLRHPYCQRHGIVERLGVLENIKKGS